MKKSIFILLLGSGLYANGQSYSKLDSILSTINNKDLEIFPVMPMVIIGPSSEKKIIIKDSTTIVKKRPRILVSSFYYNIQELATEFTEKLLATKLYYLLADSEKDMYADALLFQLFNEDGLYKLLFMTRSEWINSGKQQCDMEFWQTFLSEKGLIQKESSIKYY